MAVVKTAIRDDYYYGGSLELVTDYDRHSYGSLIHVLAWDAFQGGSASLEMTPDELKRLRDCIDEHLAAVPEWQW